MKKSFSLLVLMLSVCFIHAQDVSGLENGPATVSPTIKKTVAPKLLKKEDFKLEEGRMIATNRSCQIQHTNKTLVSVVCQQKAFKEAGVERINQMIIAANDRIGNSINAEKKYKPTEIKMAYNPELKNWSLTNLYTVEVGNGKTKSGLMSLDFDSAGKLLDVKRVF